MDNYKQQIREFYNLRTAYDYEDGTHHPQEANLLLKYAPVSPGQKILDIATGTGLVAIPAANIVGSDGYVIGIDMTPVMLQQARLKVDAACLQNIELIEADVEYVNFNDGSFDIIFCCSAIVLLTDIFASLQKWYRFLKTGGFVAFTCPPETAYLASIHTSVYARVFGSSLPHILEPLGTPEKCRNLLQQAGFRNIEIEIASRGQYRQLHEERLFFWLKNSFYVKDNLLAKLSPSQLEQLQAEYKAELDNLATDQGIWEDATTFFVRAEK